MKNQKSSKKDSPSLKDSGLGGEAILVIRFSALGDVAMMVPVLLHLSKSYPDLKITIVSKKFHEPIFAGIPNVSFYQAQLQTKHKGVLGLNQLYSELKSLDIDAVADLHNVLRTNILKLFFKVGGYKFLQIDKGRDEKKALTRPKNKVFKQLKSTHQRYADVFSGLGYPIDVGKTNFLKKQSLSERIQVMVGDSTQKWIGIAPFAAHTGKMYPIDRMQEVIIQLASTHQYKIFLFGGGKKENEILERIVARVTSVVNITGKLTFAEELQLISNLDVMVSMDSANAHLAANYGIPVITLWGVTHPFAGFYPYAQPFENALLPDRVKFPLLPTSIYGNKVPNGYENVMETITVDKVVSKIREVLNV